jgi:endonuclease/exonuclease/phosphatase family metal-dependent hydrolase
MSMDVSYRLHVVGDAPARASVLPALPGSTSYEPSALDRAGEQVQRSLPLVAASSIAGGAIGAKLLRLGGGGIFRGLLGGIAGVLGGAAIGIGALATLRGIGAHRPTSAARDGQIADPQVVARERVKVMTYNLHGGMGGPGEFRASSAELDELAEVIRREQPDVLLLQEVDRFATRSNHKDVLAELGERLGSDSAVGATAMTAVTGREQDVAVMTFHGFEIEDARNIVHSDPRGGGFGVRAGAWFRDAKTAVGSVIGKQWDGGTRYQVRNTIDALVRTPAGNAVRVLSGHYEWPSATVDHQKRQVGAIAGALDAWDGPTIWGADFNVRTGSPAGRREHELMGSAGMNDAFEAVDESRRIPIPEQASNPAYTTHPDGGIDRIYASDHATALEARVVRDAGDASDHLPVVAEYELTPVDSSQPAA